MSNIMLCTEKLEVGGAETALITQALAMRKKGHNVVVLAQDGIYTDLLKNKEIVVINFEFVPQNGINLQKTKEIIEIIEKYNIDQVHIHKFFCIQYVWLACIIKNIPYISYNHTLTDQDYTWFKNTYPFYKYFLNTYYLNAARIVLVTERSLENSLRRFPDVPLEKYVIVPNCIDFEQYNTKNKVKNINKFLLISRLAEGKMPSIKNGIDLFVRYVDMSKDNNLELDILGDGSCYNEVYEYVKNEKN